MDTLPNEWRMCRLKSVASIRYGLGQPPAELASGVAMIRATDVDAGTIRTENLMRVDPQELPPGRNPYLKTGEIIVVRSGAYTGDSAIVPPDLEYTVAGYDMVVTVTRASSHFIAYGLLSKYVLEDQIHLLTLRAAQPHLNAEELGSIVLAMPPTRHEQQRIAAYLDASCAAIDAAVATKRRQINTLEALLKTTLHTAVTRGLGETAELRDSGYELLVQLPVKWGLIAIKRIVSTKITDGPHETPEFTDEGAQFISAEAIKNSQIDFDQRRGFISWELHEQYCRKCKPQKRDIFVIKSGATTGNVAYVDVDFEFSIWSPLALVRCDERIAFYKFIYYVFLTDVFRKQVELSWSFGTQQNIGMRVIERIKVPIPPVVEQREIVAFLDDETSKVLAIKSNIESQISTLTSYRKSLIHECVTGQRRITEADVAQAHRGREAK